MPKQKLKTNITKTKKFLKNIKSGVKEDRVKKEEIERLEKSIEELTAELTKELLINIFKRHELKNSSTFFNLYLWAP